MTSGPDDRSTLTIKFGRGYEDPWFVASGNPATIRRQLLEFAGLEDEPDKTLQQLGIEVASETQAMWAARSKAGGQRLPAAASKAPTDDTPVEAAEPAKPAEDPNQFILDALADADTTEDLVRVFAKNKDAFTKSADLQGAFLARKNILTSTKEK